MSLLIPQASRRQPQRAPSGPALHALLGAIVTSCLATQCGGTTDSTDDADNADRLGGETDTSGAGGDSAATESASSEDEPAGPVEGEGGAVGQGGAVTQPGSGGAEPAAGGAAGSPQTGGGGAAQAGSGGATQGQGGTAQAGSGGTEVGSGGAAQAGTGGTLGEGGGVAAGGSGGSAPIGTPADPICSESGVARIVTGLNPVEPTDYIALHSWGGPDDSGTPAMLLDEDGEACSSATDVATCQAELEVPPTPSGFDRTIQVIAYEYLVFTRGDSVGHILDQEQLLAFLGPIDTPNEAALVLWGVNRPIQCSTLYELPDGSYAASGEYTTEICPVTTQQFDLNVSSTGDVTQTAVGSPNVTNLCVGRRPGGLCAAGDGPARNAAGAYFASVARLESAAVLAFGLLERELVAHGAPATLLTRLRAAARDEVRHAKQMAQLAQRFGAATEAAVAAVGPVRTLLEIALENAREGCVRELYGAVVAAWQARRAADAEVKKVFEGIARDEAEHASLSLAVGLWIEEQLSPAERAQVETEKLRARAELHGELAVEPDYDVARLAGLPGAKQAQALLGSLTDQLLAA
jgi:hypothetical protein